MVVVVLLLLLLSNTSHNHEHKIGRLSSESWWTNLYEYDINQYCSHTWFAPGISHLSNRNNIENSGWDISISSSFISTNVNRFYWFVIIVVSIGRWDWLMARKWKRKTEQRRMFFFLFLLLFIDLGRALECHCHCLENMSIYLYMAFYLNFLYAFIFTVAFGTFGFCLFFFLLAVVREHTRAHF